MLASNFWGNLILKLREEQRISQRTLATTAQVNRATLRRLEAGDTPGDVDVLERLLGCLGYELDALRLESKQRMFPDELYRNPERRSKLAVIRVLSINLT